MSTIMPAALSYDFNKICGALRLIMSLRSWRCRLSPCGAPWLRQDLRSCKTYDVPAELMMISIFAPLRVDTVFKIMATCNVIVLMASGYCNTLCWSRLQGKASKTHARRLPRSPCSARRFHSIGFMFFTSFQISCFFIFFMGLVFLFFLCITYLLILFFPFLVILTVFDAIKICSFFHSS